MDNININILWAIIGTIVIVVALGFLYWISNLIIKKTGRLKGKNEQSLTHGKNLIFKTIFFVLYLIFVTLLGILDAEAENTKLLETDWYQLILFIIPSLIFSLWFLTEYVFIIFLKCVIGKKELEKQILLDKKNEEKKEEKKEEKEEEKEIKKLEKNIDAQIKKESAKKTKTNK